MVVTFDLITGDVQCTACAQEAPTQPSQPRTKALAAPALQPDSLVPLVAAASAATTFGSPPNACRTPWQIAAQAAPTCFGEVRATCDGDRATSAAPPSALALAGLDCEAFICAMERGSGSAEP